MRSSGVLVVFGEELELQEAGQSSATLWNSIPVDLQPHNSKTQKPAQPNPPTNTTRATAPTMAAMLPFPRPTLPLETPAATPGSRNSNAPENTPPSVPLQSENSSPRRWLQELIFTYLRQYHFIRLHIPKTSTPQANIQSHTQARLTPASTSRAPFPSTASPPPVSTAASA